MTTTSVSHFLPSHWVPFSSPHLCRSLSLCFHSCFCFHHTQYSMRYLLRNLGQSKNPHYNLSSPFSGASSFPLGQRFKEYISGIWIHPDRSLIIGRQLSIKRRNMSPALLMGSIARRRSRSLRLLNFNKHLNMSSELQNLGLQCTVYRVIRRSRTVSISSSVPNPEQSLQFKFLDLTSGTRHDR